MSDTWRAVILGIVEGLTEFLPVSSTGHLVLVQPLLDLQSGDEFWSGAFNIFIQIGAILAVIIYFWRRLWRLAAHPGGRPLRDHILVKLFVAFLPAAVTGLLFHRYIEDHLEFPLPVAGALIAGGVAILLIERRRTRPTVLDAGDITLAQAFLIGVAQCAALFPGVSRAAATIMGGLLVGLSTAAAAEFSFFLAIPTLTAAGMFALLKHLDRIHHQEGFLLTVGFGVSFVTAWVVVAAFMRFIRTHRFTAFAVYRIILGIVVIALCNRL
jgi:undecaprenyl-diphosphatase